MGALEYVPAMGPSVDLSEEINVKEMVRFASEVLQSREEERAFKTEETYQLREKKK